MLLIFIVLVAAFSITNTLITSVYQKTREIGILKALGAGDGCVTLVFVFQGLLAGVIGWGEGVTPMLAERIETEIKYAGYIARQDRMIHDMARREKTLIPADFSYEGLTGLTLEAREKLSRIRPRSLGQAGRIPGVSPSDLAQLSIALAAAQKQNKEAHHD